MISGNCGPITLSQSKMTLILDTQAEAFNCSSIFNALANSLQSLNEGPEAHDKNKTNQLSLTLKLENGFKEHKGL